MSLIPLLDTTSDEIKELRSLATVVHHKRGMEREFCINLFERCNLSCPFCWQSHADWTGIDTIVDKADIVIANRIPGWFHNVSLMGGELFMDELPDSVFDDYFAFCNKVRNHLDDFEISFTTNLVFDNTERVFKLFQRLRDADIPFSMGTSYDPSGRFNSKTLAIWERNLRIFDEYVNDITVVMTRQNIRKFTGGDDVFDKLYGRYQFYFDYYAPEDNWRVMQPTEKEIVDFLLLLNKTYPECNPVKAWRNSTNNTTTCRSAFVIQSDGSVGSCRLYSNRRELKSDVNAVDIHESEGRFLKSRGCIECEYFQRCGLGCFLHNDHFNVELTGCEFKRLHYEIERSLHG